MRNEENSMPDVQYQWVSVEIDSGIPFEFSNNALRLVRCIPTKPAVYRWAVFEKQVLRKVYIGETDNLRRRIREYLNPGPTQHTNRRLNSKFKTYIQKELTVQLEILKINPIYLNNVYLCDDRLSDQYIRKMMENFTLADSDVTQYEMLNATLNPIERRKRKAMKDNPLEAFFQERGLTD
jgi:hypothetical protein